MFSIEPVKSFVSKLDFFASNCSAQIFTYVPMTLILSANYLTNGWLKELSFHWFHGKAPAYIMLACLFISLLVHLIINYKNYALAEDLKTKGLEQKESIMTIIYRMRLEKETTRKYLEKKTQLHQAAINRLLDDDLGLKSNKQLLGLFQHLEDIYLTRHPHKKRFFQSAFTGLLHGLAHLNVPIILKVFADKDILRDNDGSFETRISRGIVLLGIYSIFQSMYYNLKPKIPRTNDLLTCLNRGFFQDKVSLQQFKIDESMPLLLNREELEPCNVAEMVMKRAHIDANMPCCLSGLKIG